MTDASEGAALFVVHRCTDWQAIVQRCREARHRRVLILSSHEFFPTERSGLLAQLAPASANFVTFADLLKEGVLARIDAETTEALRVQRPRKKEYFRCYEDLATFKKNEAAWAGLSARQRFSELYSDDGLGIDASLWLRAGARHLCQPDSSVQWRKSLRAMLAKLCSRWLAKAPSITTIDDGPSRYFFLGSLHRLQLRPGTTPLSVPATETIPSGQDDRFAAVALHDYSPTVHDLHLPVRIFVDGYLPSNYPRSYLDHYGPAEFVCPDPFSARWLRGHGFKTVRPPAFILSPEIAPATPLSRVRTIILLLNHAGDWSALVNRSDTDRLVMVFCAMAARFPQLSFVVRPHPGAEVQSHEGPGAVARIGSFVTQCNLPNLTLSTVSLAHDLERGELFVSEYSAALIEAWRRGRLGVSVNVTGRRSFMQDFSDLGFAQAGSADALAAILADAAANPRAVALRQSVAADSYNALLRTHLAG